MKGKRKNTENDKECASLLSLAPGEEGRIACLDLLPRERRRLVDLGCYRGAQVACIGESPLGDPRTYMFLGGAVALRNSDAKRVLLSKESGADGSRMP